MLGGVSGGVLDQWLLGLGLIVAEIIVLGLGWIVVVLGLGLVVVVGFGWSVVLGLVVILGLGLIIILGLIVVEVVGLGLGFIVAEIVMLGDKTLILLENFAFIGGVNVFIVSFSCNEGRLFLAKVRGTGMD